MATILLLFLVCLLAFPGVAGAEPSPNPSGVTYEIFVGSFADSNGDGKGDLQGIIQKLDYLESLHISRIWLTPIHPSPSYHRYDVSDYLTVDPALGTLEDFMQLVAEAKSRGITILLDLVVNHTALDHPWFQQACAALATGGDSPYIAWYHFTQGEGQHPVPGAAGWFYEGQFTSHMPDLNLDHPDVRQEIDHIITYWQGLGVGGFRLDAVTSYYTSNPVANTAFLKFLSDVANRNDPDTYIVGEAWTNEQAILQLYDSGIDSLFNFPAGGIDGSLIRAALYQTGARAAERLSQWNQDLLRVSPGSYDAPFLTNHDIDRSAGMLRGDLAKQKVAASLMLLAPGNPMIYYGEEIGMFGSGRDENKRLPMLWSASNAEGMTQSPADADQTQRLKSGADEQEADPNSLLNHYRAVLELRSQFPVFETAEMIALDVANEAIACYTLTRDGDTIGVLINTDTEHTMDIPYPFEGEEALAWAVGGVQLTEHAIHLPGGACAVFRIKSTI